MAIINNTTPFRRKRIQSRKPSPTPPVAPPTLAAASFDPETGLYVQLQFDQAVDPSGVVGNQIMINDDQFSGREWVADGAITIVNPTTIRLGVSDAGGTEGPGLKLTAGAGNGIVSADSGEMWSGVTDLALPFP